MKLKKFAAKAAAIIFAIALILPAAATKAEAAGTLADAAIGTTFKLREDGTLFDWILVSHNYGGTGNQLLMRKNTITYSSTLAYKSGIYYYDDDQDGASYDPFYALDFCNSSISTYLNSDYITKFSGTIQNKLVQTNISVITSLCNSQTTAKSIGDSLYGVTGTVKKPFKVFILSSRELGLGNDATFYNTSPLGTAIDYFTSNTQRASDNFYVLRDAVGHGFPYTVAGANFTYVTAAGAKSTNKLSNLTCYRPCIVLPADTPATAGAEIVGEIIPTISAATAQTDWGKTNTITVTATNATHYGISTSATAPTSWQTSNELTVNANGTYYAFVKSSTGNTAYKKVTVSKVDTTAPAISAADVPDGWATSKTVNITATDSQSGISGYTVTTENITPSTGAGWQASSQFTFTSNGNYYVWAKDNADNVSSGFGFEISKIDTDKPVISDVTYPSDWVSSAQIKINAADASSEIAEYAISRDTNEPLTGWQPSPDFTLTANGSYYAWAKDQAGNTAYKYFYISSIDDTKPTVISVTVPTVWGSTVSVTINASDTGSGAALYAVTTADEAPLYGWQGKKIDIDANGTYYAWVKDAVGNVSASGYMFEVDKVDSIKPVISSVNMPTDWAKSCEVTISASDEGGSGLSKYALTTVNSAPSSGWQLSPSFTITANGSYFAWAVDVAGNISAGYELAAEHIDTSKPVITSVTIPEVWNKSCEITVNAFDEGSGAAMYAVSTNGNYPPTLGWQSDANFTFSSNGTYYAWAKDLAGNISAEGYKFELDRVDATEPEITEIILPTEWTNKAFAIINAADSQSGISGYALTTDTHFPSEDKWQLSNEFELTANGSYYAWAKDGVGNYAYRYFFFNKLDNTLPEISSVNFNTNNTVITVSATDTDSGVKSIIIDNTAYNGSYTQYQLPAGTKYVTLQAEDNAGNRSPVRRERVPGWYDTLGTLSITSVDFDADITTATITAETTATAIKGIYVNDKFYESNPVVYALGNSTKYLVMQAEDVNSDRSALYKVRVPGWNEQTAALEITGCVFSEDNTSAVITATETVENEADRRGITGIKINGEFFEGNPVAYPIPEGTRHLEMVAYNTDGDYSPTLIRRVPGWSEIVSTLAITNCQFSDYNKRATVTALATGGDSVAGIFVNGEFFEGNPVVYSIDKKTEVLHLQAANYNGDLSAMVNKDVPQDTSKSTLKLTITAPGWTSANRAKVKIAATDKLSIREVLAKTGEDDDWVDVTDSRYIYITEDTTVWASAENDEGTVKEAYLDITCFDRKAPTITAAQQDKVVNIRAEDDKSGVKAIYVNNVEYSGSKIYGGNLRYTIPDGVTTVTVRAVDEAGNESETVELGVRTTVTAIPMTIAPSAPSAPEPEPQPPAAAIPEPEPEPQPQAEPEPEPVPKPEPQEEPEAAGMTTAQMAAIAAGAFSLSSAATGGTVWWLIRKRRMNRVVPELDYKGYRLKYDESDYHGSVDPLEDNVTEVVFNKKIS